MIIRKEFGVQVMSNWSNKEMESFIGLVIDDDKETISMYQINDGVGIDIDQFIYCALADKDVRNMIRGYNKDGRKYPCKMFYHTGMSGCCQYFIQYLRPVGDFAYTKKKFLCYSTCFGKSDGFKDIWIGDFVELACDLNYTADMNPKHLLKMANARYVKPRLLDDAVGFHNATKVVF